MKKGTFEVRCNTRIAEKTYRMLLEGDISAVTAPGQFVNIELDGFFLRRPIQQICREEPESFSAVFHPDEGAFRFRDLLAYHRRGPPLQGGRNVFMSVCLISPHRNEKGAGTDFSAVITDVRDLQFRGSAQLQHRDVPQDFFQFHARVSMIDRSVSIRPTSITVPKATCSPGSRLWRCTSMVLESVGGTPEVRTNSPKASKYCTAAR